MITADNLDIINDNLDTLKLVSEQLRKLGESFNITGNTVMGLTLIGLATMTDDSNDNINETVRLITASTIRAAS